jgi:hypothetical protein
MYVRNLVPSHESQHKLHVNIDRELAQRVSMEIVLVIFDLVEHLMI